MSMREPVFLIVMMSILIVVISGVFVAARLYGANQVKGDHPR